jgi:hypothetical protein
MADGEIASKNEASKDTNDPSWRRSKAGLHLSPDQRDQAAQSIGAIL